MASPVLTKANLLQAAGSSSKKAAHESSWRSLPGDSSCLSRLHELARRLRAVGASCDGRRRGVLGTGPPNRKAPTHDPFDAGPA